MMKGHPYLAFSLHTVMSWQQQDQVQQNFLLAPHCSRNSSDRSSSGTTWKGSAITALLKWVFMLL
jgi:hypothetical protein